MILEQKVGVIGTLSGAAAAVSSWGLSLNAVFAMVGCGVAVAGFLLNLWATLRRDRREAVEHKADMEGRDDGADDSRAA